MFLSLARSPSSSCGIQSTSRPDVIYNPPPSAFWVWPVVSSQLDLDTTLAWFYSKLPPDVRIPHSVSTLWLLVSRFLGHHPEIVTTAGASWNIDWPGKRRASGSAPSPPRRFNIASASLHCQTNNHKVLMREFKCVRETVWTFYEQLEPVDDRWFNSEADFK